MGLTLNSSTPLAALYASASGAGAASAADSSGKATAAFASSLTEALDAMASTVQVAQTKLADGAAGRGDAGLQSTLSSMGALVQQFRQALELVAGAGQQALGPSATSATQALQAARTAQDTSVAAANGAAAAAQNPPAMWANTSVQPAVSTTEQWVRVALNQSIAQARANGYDPEKSHMVNTLRGYFSGDAQARSNAIHSIDFSMLQAGGAYETFDGGVHAIAGKPPQGLDTSMPVFKTAYDKDWNRPSLYDQINSSLGWEGEGDGTAGTPVNFADPAHRDAELNRKLSDAEVTAFQSGQLTPELQTLVTRYRSARA